MTELETTCAKLEAVNRHRAALIEYRDRQILEELASGTTWATVQRITGLSKRGLALAVKRIPA